MSQRTATAVILAACLVLIVLVYHVGVEAGRAQRCAPCAPVGLPPPY